MRHAFYFDDAPNPVVWCGSIITSRTRRRTYRPTGALRLNTNSCVLSPALCSVAIPSHANYVDLVTNRKPGYTWDCYPINGGMKTNKAWDAFSNLGAVETLLRGNLTTLTMCIVRELYDTVYGNGVQHGYNDGSPRVSVSVPYTDGNVYWDYGSTNTGSGSGAGRVSCAAPAFAVGAVDKFVFVAGPTKGREIWYNGKRIANSGGTASRATTSYNFQLGGAGGSVGGVANPEIIYQFLLSIDEWSDERIGEWSDDPWQIVRVDAQPSYFVFPDAGGGAGTYDVANAEASTASDAPLATAQFMVAGADSGTAADSPLAVGLYAASIAESAVGADGNLTLQQLRPASDVSKGGWTASVGTDLYAMVDEAAEDDADYIQSSANPTADTCEIKLAPGAVPLSGVAHSVSYAIQQTGGASSCVVGYYCGTTLIAEWTHATLPDALTRFDQQVTEAQAATITDPTDLRLRFTAS